MNADPSCKKGTMELLNTLWSSSQTRLKIIVNNPNHSFIWVSPENPMSKVDQIVQRKISLDLQSSFRISSNYLKIKESRLQEDSARLRFFIIHMDSECRAIKHC